MVLDPFVDNIVKGSSRSNEVMSRLEAVVIEERENIKKLEELLRFVTDELLKMLKYEDSMKKIN